MAKDRQSPNRDIELLYTDLLLKLGAIATKNPGAIKEFAAIASQLERLRADYIRLRKDRDRYKSYVENANDTIAAFDLDGTMTYTSPNWKLQLGHSKHEIKIQDIFKEYFHPDDYAAARAFLQKTIDTKEKQSGFIYRIRNKEGDYKWHTASLSPIMDSSGNVVSVLAIAHDIDRQKRFEDENKKDHKQLILLLDTMQEGVIFVNNDDDIQYINKSLCELYGFKAEDVLGKKGYKCLIHEDDWHIILEKNKLRKAGVKDQYVVRGKKTNGDIIQIWVSGAPIIDESGNAIGSVGVMSDITDQIQAQLAFEKSEKKYRNLYENTVMGVFQSGFDDRYIAVNNSYAKMFGYNSPEEMTSSVKDIHDLYVDPSDRDRFKEILLQNKQVENFVARLKRRDSKAFWALINARLVKIDDSDPVIDATCIDITHRVESEAEMYRLHSILDNSSNEIYLFNAETFLFEYANKGAQNNLGYSLEELYSMTPTDMADIGTKDQLISILEPLVNKEKDIINLETTHIRKDGSTYPVAVSIQLDELKQDPVFLVIANDETERKSLKDQLAASQKMEAIGKLAGGIAHDFNNMLTVILGYSDDLSSSMDDADPLKEGVVEIEKAAEKAAKLTRQLLTFSRKQIIQPRILNPNQLITNLQSFVVRLIGENISFQLDLNDHVANIEVDPGQFEQVIMNLVVNARDAMPLGGNLRISTQNLAIDHTYSGSHSEITPGKYVMISVSDNGCGMDQDTQAKVFEPFFTTKGVGKGSGLGLSTVYGIISQAEGHILLYSIPLEGTTFKILLPASEADPSPMLPKEQFEDYNGQGESILIVEDEEAVGHFIQRMLTNLNYKVMMATSGMDALEIIRGGFKPELILTDIVMPGITGKQLADQLNMLLPNCSILYMSGFNDDALATHGVLGQDVPFIQKPFSSQDVASLIRRILKKSRMRSGSQDQVSETLVTRSVLVVDDDSQIRNLYKLYLQRAGYNAFEASNLRTALTTLSHSKIDLLILDLKLAGITGIEVLRAIRSAGWTTPVIAVSGVIDRSLSDDLKELGVKNYLSKTMSRQEFLDSIKEALI